MVEIHLGTDVAEEMRVDFKPGVPANRALDLLAKPTDVLVTARSSGKKPFTRVLAEQRTVFLEIQLDQHRALFWKLELERLAVLHFLRWNAQLKFALTSRPAPSQVFLQAEGREIANPDWAHNQNLKGNGLLDKYGSRPITPATIFGQGEQFVGQIV